MSLLPSCQLTSVIVAVMLLAAVLTSMSIFKNLMIYNCILNRNLLRPISYIHVAGKIKSGGSTPSRHVTYKIINYSHIFKEQETYYK